MSPWTVVWRYGLAWGYGLSVTVLGIHEAYDILHDHATPAWQPLADALLMLPFTAIVAPVVYTAFHGRFKPWSGCARRAWGILGGLVIGGATGGAVTLVVWFAIPPILRIWIPSISLDGGYGIAAIVNGVLTGMVSALVGGITGAAATARIGDMAERSDG